MTGGTQTNSRSVLILGAASDIGRAIAREYGRAGRPVILSARNPERLQADVSDLRIRFSIPVRTEEFDVLKACNHDAFLDRLGELPHTVVCVIGLLGNQLRAEADAAHADLIIRTNFVGPAAILALVANRMAARGAGVIVGVSSVAGDRGRATNYVYGAAKAGFTVFLSGLRKVVTSSMCVPFGARSWPSFDCFRNPFSSACGFDRPPGRIIIRGVLVA